MKHLLIFSLILFSFTGRAQDKVGNGGDVILCPDGKIQLLDLFQGQEDWQLDPLPFFGSRDDVIRGVLKNFLSTDKTIGGLLLQRALMLSKEIRLLEEDQSFRSYLVKLTKRELVNIADEGVASLPEGCKIIQAASQVQKPFPGEAKFQFQEQNWKKMDPEVQAALILHEVIYEHLIGAGESFSRSVRYFNASLHAGRLDSVKGYFEVSSIFEFRNLSMLVDAPPRIYGARGICKVYREPYIVNRIHENNIERRGGTFVWVGKRLAATSEFYFDAIKDAFSKQISKGACD